MVNPKLELTNGLYVYLVAFVAYLLLSKLALSWVPGEKPALTPTFALISFWASQVEPLSTVLLSGVDTCWPLARPVTIGSYCGIIGPGDIGISPAIDRSFCCWLISAISEKFVFTSGVGVEPAVRFVNKGPLGPPIPGGGSFTSRLSPRSSPPPRARNRSVSEIFGRKRSSSMSRLFSSASASASSSDKYSCPARISSKTRREFRQFTGETTRDRYGLVKRFRKLSSGR